MALALQEEMAAQHLLGLKELGVNIAKAMPNEVEDRVCTPVGEKQDPLIPPVDKTPELAVSGA